MYKGLGLGVVAHTAHTMTLDPRPPELRGAERLLFKLHGDGHLVLSAPGKWSPALSPNSFVLNFFPEPSALMGDPLGFPAFRL